MNVITNKIPMKLILRMKIAYSFLHVMSKLFHTVTNFNDKRTVVINNNAGK